MGLTNIDTEMLLIVISGLIGGYLIFRYSKPAAKKRITKAKKEAAKKK